MTSEIKPEDVKLPPMPQACDITPTSWSNLFSVDQMQAYARLAVLQERERLSKIRRCLIQLASRVENAGYVRGLRREPPSDHEPEIQALVNFVEDAIRAGHSITETPLGEG